MNEFPIIETFAAIALLVIIIIATRSLSLWYWRINENLAHQELQTFLLVDIRRCLKKQMGEDMTDDELKIENMLNAKLNDLLLKDVGDSK